MSDVRPLLLVTGGSRGIGAAVAELAGQRGWAVMLTYRENAGQADAVAERIRSGGGTAFVQQCDVGDASSIAALFEAVDRTGHRLTGLVNNAGIVDTAMKLAKMDDARIERMYRVNILGATLVARNAVRRMAVSEGGEGGAIVNISSLAAKLGGAKTYVDYAASKGAIDTFTVGLGLELAGDGVRVNAVRPGVIDTEIHADTGRPNRVEEDGASLPMGRAGSAEEVAETVLFLLSEAASYTTGALIDVSGGR